MMATATLLVVGRWAAAAVGDDAAGDGRVELHLLACVCVYLVGTYVVVWFCSFCGFKRKSFLYCTIQYAVKKHLWYVLVCPIKIGR